MLKRSDYVETAHFGGGSSGQPRSSADYLEEIAEEKLKRKMEREENAQLTRKLDEDWGLVRNLIKHKGAQEEKSSGKNEDYDLLLTSLLFGDQERKPLVKKGEQKELDQAKAVSLNVVVLENLHTMMQSKNVLEVKECFDFLISCDNKRPNSSVTEQLLKYLSSKGLNKCTLRSVCLLVFALSFKELQSFAVTKLISYLRVPNYSSIEGIARKILLCHIFSTSLTQKFIPETVVALQNLLVLFCQANSLKEKFVPSFLHEKFISNNAFELDDKNLQDIGLTLILPDFFDKDLAQKECIKHKLLLLTLQVLQRFVKLYKKLDTFESIFIDFPVILSALEKRLPNLTSNIIQEITTSFDETRETVPVTLERKKPKMISMLEPRIEPLKKKHDSRKLLIKSYKREFKGAQRELRKDNAFIRETVLKGTLEKDRKRKEKVKKLMAEIAEERSMFKKKRR